MRNLIVFILFILTPIVAYSQTEATKDSVNSPDNTKLNSSSQIKNNYTPMGSESAFSSSDSPDYKETQRQEDKLELPSSLTFTIPPYYVGPPLYSTTVIPSFPYANDYNFNGVVGLSDVDWISTSSSRTTYPSIGWVRAVNAQYNHQLSDWFVMSLGTYATKFMLGNQIYHDFGPNARMTFKLNDNIQINAFGQYSTRGKINNLNMHGDMHGMYPQTNYGGTIDFMFNKKFGVGGGISRELNPFTGKWQNIPVVYPIFK